MTSINFGSVIIDTLEPQSNIMQLIMNDIKEKSGGDAIYAKSIICFEIQTDDEIQLKINDKHIVNVKNGVFCSPQGNVLYKIYSLINIDPINSQTIIYYQW